MTREATPARHRPQIEKQILGACLIDPEAVATATAILPAAAFYNKRNRAIYEAVRSMFDQGQPIDLITIGETLRAEKKWKLAGGERYLAELMDMIASGANVAFHARIVLEAYYMRNLRRIGQQLAQRGADETEDVFELMDYAEQEIYKIGRGITEGEPTPISSGLDERVEDLLTTEVPSGITGIPTGLHRLNDLTGGWQNSDLIIVAARPSVGKTAFGIGQAVTAAKKTGRMALIFSCEMSTRQLRDRVLASEAKVDSQRVRRYDLNDEEKGRVRRAAKEMRELSILIDDTPGLSIQQLKAKGRQMAYRHDLGLIVVDYLQLMTGVKGGTREQEVASISRAAKELAKELNIPILGLAQLSRSVESRGGSFRPRLSDLRESGAIENDADLVVFLHRPEQYNQMTDDEGRSTRGKAEIILAKQRNGPTGEFWASFVKRYAQFKNLSVEPTNPNVNPDPAF